MSESSDFAQFFKFFARLGTLFEARFLKPLWQRYPSQETDDWEAVGLFLTGYAFERQGAKPDYRHAATDVIDELRTRGCPLIHANTAQKVWGMFCKRLGEAKLNYANNPLCPQGTSYTRKSGPMTTYSKSLIEFLRDLSVSGLPPNIVVFAKTGLQLDCTANVHRAIQGINGIGSKIASLFLRDTAVIFNVLHTKDRHLLQPIDVWVKRVFEKLAYQKTQNSQDIESIQRGIVEGAIRVGVSPEAVNEGMWYFSSQIADSEYRLFRALDDLGYAKSLIEEYIVAVRQEVTAAHFVKSP